MKELKSLDPIIKFAGMVAATIIFMFTTFATISHEDEREVETKKYIDARIDSMQSILVEIKDSVKTTENRVYELQKDRRR